MIWAQDKLGTIGKQGSIPWHIPEDLKYFKEKTNDCNVIMGRKTWDSLPVAFKPLLYRKNIVVTTDPTFIAWGAETVLSPEAALLATDPTKFAWIIGGESLYKYFMNMAGIISVTEVDTIIENGDAFAPEIPTEQYVRIEGESNSSKDWETSVKGITYKKAIYLRYRQNQETIEKDENKFPERPSP